MPARKSKKGAGGPSRFVLMVGDEGAILVQMQKQGVTRRLFAPSPEINHTRAFDELLNSQPKAPVTIIVDMMDQSYVRQTLPPVSSFSIGKIIKRRLDKDFSRDDIKGHIILNREKTGRRDWNYLMVSLANPPLLQKWIAFAVERPNPFKGLGLLPLESQEFILAIAQSFLKDKKAQPLEWQILVSHNKVGGFRQIVLKGGKLVFTRMAQPIGEANPEVIAGNIEQEMINTQEYLKRMGLQDPSTLAVTLLASADIKRVMDAKNIKASEHHFLTPAETAELLKLEKAALPEDQFGDVVISAFIARKRKLLLPLFTPYTEKLRALASYLLSLRAVSALACLGIIGWIGMSGWDIFSTKSQTENILVQQKSIKAQLDAIKLQEKALPKDIVTYTDVMNLVKLIDKRNLDPLIFTNTFATALQGSALAKSYHWAVNDPVSAKDSKRQVTADIDMLLTPNPSHEAFIASAQALMERFKTGFAEYDVTHSELPGQLSENKDLKTVLDENGNSVAAAESNSTTDTVKVTIQGPHEGGGKNGH